MNQRTGARAAALGLALGLTLACPRLARAAPVVAAVQSNGLQTYRQLLTGFAAESPELTLMRFDLGGSGARAEAVLAQVKARSPAVILALGPLAANAVRRAIHDVPVIFVMVPSYEKYGLDAPNVTGIALTRPLDDQLGAIRAVLPAAKSVGVLYTPAFNASVIKEATAVAAKLGLTLKAQPLDGASAAAKLAPALARSVDAVWLLADRGTATVSATAALVKACRAAKVPLFALTEGQVREGALLAFTADPVAIGSQAAKLTARLVNEHVDPGALAVMPPQGESAWVNLGTSRALGIANPFSARLLEYAGQQGLAVRAVP